MNVIILPAYDEESSIKEVLTSLDLIINKEALDFTIIVCNDGSSDNTLEMIRKTSLLLKTPIHIINHLHNRGLGETIRDLFEAAVLLADNDNDVIIRMDCDKTHNPMYIQELIIEIDKGFDVVTTSRFLEGGGQIGVSNVRKIISKFANIYMKIFFPIKGISEYTSGYRAYKSSIIQKAMLIYGNDFIQLKEFGFACTLEKIVKLKLIGAKFSEIPFVLNYDMKTSKSKMVFTSTTMGYIILLVMYYWPFSGWKYFKFKHRKTI